MLTFLSGTYFPEKKKYIYEKICSLLSQGERVYLVVPEQSSFERDRDFLMTYGEKLSNMLTVTSFTHLSRDVLEENGLRVKPEADEAARSVLMSIACEDVMEYLDIFSRYPGKPLLINKLLDEYSEIRQSGLGVQELFDVSDHLPEGMLRQKILEMARIFSAYEALLTPRFSESSDNIRVMEEFLRKNTIFSGAYIFFDDFRGFTGAQIKLMEEMMAQAKECYVSVFASDSVNAYDSQSSIHAVKNCRRLRGCAVKRGIEVKEEKISSTHPVEALDALRQSLFCGEKEASENCGDAVNILCAADKYAECDLVAMKIRELLEKEGMRCRDISVTERGDRYTNTLTAALKKYGIPVFRDKRVPLFEYPLIKMILSAVSVAAYGFSTEEIFTYIKTGITGTDSLACSTLENYVYIWQIDKNAWTKAFTGHPDGFGEEFTEEAAKRLEYINKEREKLTAPLIALKQKLERNSGEASCRAVFEFLSSTDASRNFLEYAKNLSESGNEAAAIECASVWDTTVQALDALYEAIGEREVTPRRFYELLKIILSAGEIGRIPGGIDEIVIGKAGRTRHLEPTAVFVLGCNEGIFPGLPSGGGLFSPSEKRILCENDFPLENIPENIYAEERMIAYSVLTGASEKLYVSYSRTSPENGNAEPSEIISEIKSILPSVKVTDDRDVPFIERIGSEATAFEEYSAHYRENSVYSASLRSYAEESSFVHRTDAVRDAAENNPAEICDRKTAEELFGRDMYISPSRAETYHSCAFRYFCQYGMNLKKIRPADLDARINGLLIHHLLENILLIKRGKELADISEAELKELIDTVTEGFITDYMGGRDDKGVLLNRSLDKTKDTAFAILSRMIKEFAVSSFSTVAVELEISRDGDIPPYSLKLPEGGSITVGGKVDRVDIMEDGSKAYLRVVDYKTGGKDFRLSDVFDGLNMQMLIYLMCLWKNGKEKYGDIVPAGILYVPANNSGTLLKRNADADAVEAQRLINGRMNGMILEDEKVLRGMERDCEGKFINASIDDNGRMKGTFLSLNGFKLLNGKIDDILTLMGTSLHQGKIRAFPVTDSSAYKNTCTYCDYKDICRHTDENGYKEPLALSHKQALEFLKGSDDNG